MGEPTPDFMTGQNYKLYFATDDGQELFIVDDILSFTAKHNKEQKTYNLLGETAPLFELLNNGHEISFETLKRGSSMARIEFTQDDLMDRGKLSITGVLTVIKNSVIDDQTETTSYSGCKIDIESETVGERTAEVKYSVRILASRRKHVTFIQD